MNIESFAYLWLDKSGRYVLIRFPDLDPMEMLPFDLVNRSAILIDDDGLSRSLVQRMMDEGVPISEGLPSEV